MIRTIAQPSPAPTRKITAVGGTAAAVTLLVWATHRFAGWDLDPELAALIVGALSALAGYVVKERRARTDVLAENARHQYPPAPRRPPDDTGLT